MCRYNYGGKYCAHRMIDARECMGERNCLERAAPSYHCRSSRSNLRSSERQPKRSPLSAFSRSIDLHIIELGLPLAPGRP